MICQNAILSDEYMDYIWKADVNPPAEMDLLPYGVCAQYISPSFSVYYISRKEVFGNRTSLPIGDYALPWCYTQLNTESLETTKILQVQNQPALNLRGQGVILGFLDSGIELKQMTFRKADGKTRVLELWDQTDQSGRSPEGFQYGSVYTSEDIDKLLAEEQEVLPGKDENGHGTFLAGVAAASETADYIGAAPEAEILMVKLKPAKKYLRDFYLLPERVEAYSETDMMMGVRFLQQYAIREKKPLVICVGLGTASGSRTGALPFADLLNTLARQVNTVVVTCTGNEANNRTHTSGLAVSDTEPSEIEITVGADERGFVMEIWAESLDILSVAITSPSGERISRIPARIDTGGVYNFLLERSQVAVNYRVVESASGYEVIFMRFINPAQGIWKIHVYSLTNIVGRYNAWLPLKQFLSGDTYFLNSNPSTTLTEPGAAERVISVGAYNHITDASYAASGRGYTATGLVKPDFVAPGVDVYGVRAGGGYTTRTGTSVAAAHAAGAAALLLTWGVTDGNLPYMGTNEVKSVLIRGAKRENNTVYPNNIYGYGKMDVIEAFYKLRTG